MVNRRTVQSKIDLARYVSICYRGKLTIDLVSDRIPLPMMNLQALDLYPILDPFDDETDVASDKLIVSFAYQSFCRLLISTLHYGTSTVQRDWTSRLYIVRKFQSEDTIVLSTLTGC